MAVCGWMRRACRNACRFGLLRDEQGLTTTGMALSLLITISLVFTAAQVYRINSASAEVQDVADAAALAAENQVAEFMLVARFCDAVVLSLSLTGLAATGLGVAALCTPVTAAFSEELLQAGHELVSARNSFSERANQVLGKLQEALPFFAAACAANVAMANNADSEGSNYVGIAVLVPSSGEPIEIASADEAEELLDDIDERADDIRQLASEAEEASKQANQSKERAFMCDCGNNPGYCMYERAGQLAGLSGAANPLYASVDTWSFQVALDRARSYYRARLSMEAPASSSVEEQARSALRERFYRYAVDALEEAYVHESEGSFEAYFPHLPRSTSAMRQTSLYTEKAYPVTKGPSGKSVMHAWAGCPQASGADALGSIAQLEKGNYETCPACGFTAASLGKVAAASTSTENGFEHYYEAVASEAELYQKERQKADLPKSQVEESAGALFDDLAKVAKDTVNRRISVSPPGKYGAVAFVVNVGSTSAAGPFANSFVAATGSLGPRAAVSAATLVDEGSDEERTILNSALDNLKEGGGAVVGAAGIVLDVWSWMLGAYSNGQDFLLQAIEQGLGALPLVGESGLGPWASEKLSSAISEVGLQPAELGALKPVLVNSALVAAKGEGSFAEGYLAVKQRVVAHPLASTDLFSALLTDAERTALDQAENLGDSVQIASIEILGAGGPSIPITIPIPAEVKAFGAGAVQDLFARLRSFYASTVEVYAWE